MARRRARFAFSVFMAALNMPLTAAPDLLYCRSDCIEIERVGDDAAATVDANAMSALDSGSGNDSDDIIFPNEPERACTYFARPVLLLLLLLPFALPLPFPPPLFPSPPVASDDDTLSAPPPVLATPFPLLLTPPPILLLLLASPLLLLISIKAAFPFPSPCSTRSPPCHEECRR